MRPHSVPKSVQFTLPDKAKEVCRLCNGANFKPTRDPVSHPKPGPVERADLLDPLNELLAYIDPRETVARLMTRTKSFNEALFNRIIDIDSFVCLTLSTLN